jgi:hypothetical protein
MHSFWGMSGSQICLRTSMQHSGLTSGRIESINKRLTKFSVSKLSESDPPDVSSHKPLIIVIARKKFQFVVWTHESSFFHELFPSSSVSALLVLGFLLLILKRILNRDLLLTELSHPSFLILRCLPIRFLMNFCFSLQNVFLLTLQTKLQFDVCSSIIRIALFVIFSPPASLFLVIFLLRSMT